MESFILISFTFVIIMIITIIAALLKFLWIWVRMRIYLWRLSHFPFANQPLYFLVARKVLELLHRAFRKTAWGLQQQGHFSISEPAPPTHAMTNQPMTLEPVILKEEKPSFHTSAMVVKMPGYAHLNVAEFYTMLEEDRQRRLMHKLQFFEEQNSLASFFFEPIVRRHPDWVLKINKRQSDQVLHVLEAIRFWKESKAIRILESWSPPLLATIDQYLDDLIHHLFARYAVPSFIQRFWRSCKRWRMDDFLYPPLKREGTGDPRLNSCFFDLYFHLVAGGSLRKADFLPFHLSKRAAGLYPEAPADLSPVQAFWWATFTAYGGHASKWRTIIRFDFNLEQQDFWKQFLMIVARDPKGRDPYFAYQIIQLIKFGEGALAYSGVLDLLSRIEPDFSLKGRTLESVEAYFKRLTATEGLRYPLPSKLAKEYLITGPEDQSYRIVWLDSCRAMMNESEEMYHCLGDLDQGYHLDALEGYKSYWSLRLRRASGEEERLATIELDVDRIMQISGPHNESLEPQHQNIILGWAREQGLSLVPAA